MNYIEIEKTIVESTKEFAENNNVHYDSMTESMIKNALRELKKVFFNEFTNCVKEITK